MATLGPLPTRLTLANMNAELSDQWLARNVGLELFVGAGLNQLPLAMRTGVREVGIITLIDSFGRGHGPVGMGPMVGSRFATGRFGFGLGRTFSEGGGLSLAGTASLLERLGHLGQPRFECRDPLKKFPGVLTV